MKIEEDGIIEDYNNKIISIIEKKKHMNIQFLISRYKACLELERDGIERLNKIWAEKHSLNDEYFRIKKSDLGLDISQGIV